MFSPEGSGTAGTSDFIKDAFYDVSNKANSNGSLTSNASTNPLGLFLNNTDQPLYGSKILWLKDLTQLEDRSKWISGKPTYTFSLNENFPSIQVYGFGNVVEANRKQNQTGFVASTINSGFGVTGKIRRLVWITDASYALVATAQLKTDGSNTTTADFSTLGITPTITFPPIGNQPIFRTFPHQATSETNNLHDFQITAIQNNNLVVYGVIVYFENASANIECQPGSTYVNKQKITSVVGSTLPLLTAGSSLGGVASIYKVGAGYTQSIQSAPSVVSIAQGSSGTNLLNVSTGHGSSFPIGSGIVVAQGTSNYVGFVSSVSTDTITVSPTLAFGISNTIYKMWQSAPTLSISPTLFTKIDKYDFSNQSFPNGGSFPINIYNPETNVNYSFMYMGLTTQPWAVDKEAYFQGATGVLRIEGNFQAAEIEFSGVSGGIANWNVGVDGLIPYTINQGVTGTLKHTLFTDAGPGGHLIHIMPGTSNGVIGIKSITTFKNAGPGISYGVLADYAIPQSFTSRTEQNATMTAIGLSKRHYAENLYLKGGWSLGVGNQWIFARSAMGLTTTAEVNLTYFGRQFCLHGTATAATLTVDGAGTAYTMNSIIDPGSEGLHTINFRQVTGATISLEAIDTFSSAAVMSDKQNFSLKTYLDEPKKKKRLYFNADCTNGETLGNGSFVTITYSSIKMDSHNIANFQNNVPPSARTQLRVPNDGTFIIKVKYELASNAAWNAVTESFVVYMVVNDVVVANNLDNGKTGTFGYSGEAVFIVDLKKSDSFSIAMTQNSGADIALASDPNTNNIMITEFYA